MTLPRAPHIMYTCRSDGSLAETVIYRFGNESAVVGPASNYGQALDYAEQAFPQLKAILREHILLRTMSVIEGKYQSSRIAESAWEPVIGRLLKQWDPIIEIFVEQPPAKQDHKGIQSFKSSADLTTRLLDGVHSSQPVGRQQSEHSSGIREYFVDAVSSVVEPGWPEGPSQRGSPAKEDFRKRKLSESAPSSPSKRHRKRKRTPAVAHSPVSLYPTTGSLDTSIRGDNNTIFATFNLPHGGNATVMSNSKNNSSIRIVRA